MTQEIKQKTETGGRMKLIQTKDYLLLIDKESEIKEGDKIIYKELYNRVGNAGEDNLSLEYFSKILAYYPLNSEAKELDLPLLPNPFENNMLVLLDKDIPSVFSGVIGHEKEDYNKGHRESWIKGYKASQSKQFSLEDMKKAIEMARTGYGYDGNIDIIAHLDMGGIDNYSNEFKFKSEEEIIQSLSTQQFPKDFIPEYEYKEVLEKVDELSGKIGVTPRVIKLYKTLKTITNSDGKEELVGVYKY